MREVAEVGRRRHRGSGEITCAVVASLGASYGFSLMRLLHVLSTLPEVRRSRAEAGVGLTGAGDRDRQVDAAAATGAVLCPRGAEAATPRMRFGPRRRRASQEPSRVGADVGAERLPRAGPLGCGLARDAPPRGAQRAAVEGQGAVRFRSAGAATATDAAGAYASASISGKAVELLRERPRFRRPRPWSAKEEQSARRPRRAL